MTITKFGRLAAVAIVGAALQATPSISQTTNECSTYSIRVCGDWQSLGYTSLKECRLQEYANCRNGVPPYEPDGFTDTAALFVKPAPVVAASHI